MIKWLTSKEEVIKWLTSKEEAIKWLTSKEEAIKWLTSKEEAIKWLTSKEEAIKWLTSKEEATKWLTSKEEAIKWLTSKEEATKWLTSKEEDNNDRVDDGEPVDLDVTHVQVGVPPRRPLYITLFPRHLVCKHDIRCPCNRHRLKIKLFSCHVKHNKYTNNYKTRGRLIFTCSKNKNVSPTWMLDINALISMVYILSRLAHYVDEINLGLW